MSHECIFTRPQGYKTFFMLSSGEHEFFKVINVKIPTVVGILTFMNRKNSILGLSETEKADFLLFFLCPRHKMAEGHIASYLSVCLCVPESCPGHNLAKHDGI